MLSMVVVVWPTLPSNSHFESGTAYDTVIPAWTPESRPWTVIWSSVRGYFIVPGKLAVSRPYAGFRHPCRNGDFARQNENCCTLQLLSTVHWVAHRGGPKAHAPASTPDEAYAQICGWNRRKENLFTREHVGVAWGRWGRWGGWVR